MMAGVGGYMPPKNPAPVSGPGAMSQRTDGGPGDKKLETRWMSTPDYGGGTELQGIQAQAPLDGGREVTRMDAPTQYPAEPVTHGASFGPGPTLQAPDPYLDLPGDAAEAMIRRAYEEFPTPQLRRLVDQFDKD